MTTLQPAGAAMESLEAAGRHVALLVAEIERLKDKALGNGTVANAMRAQRDEAFAHIAALEAAGDVERKNKLLAETLQTLHNYCAAQYALYGDTAPLILREAIAAISKELT